MERFMKRVAKLVALGSVVCAIITLSLMPTFGANQLNGSNTCPSSGAKALSSTQTKASLITVQNAYGNAGNIYIGGPSVTSTTGIALTIGDSYTFPPQSNSQPYDLSKTYFACANSADSVVFVYAQ